MNGSINTFGILTRVCNTLLTSFPLLLILYGVFVLIGYVWSGLRKFIRLFLIPGMILHYASHFLAVKLLASQEENSFKRRQLVGIGMRGDNEWTYSMIRTTSTKDALIIAIMPAAFTIPLVIFLTRTFLLTNSLLLGWLTLSILLEGLPNTHDYQLIFTRGIADKPHAYILLPWTIVVGILSYYVYPNYAILITISYFLTISFILLYPDHTQEKNKNTKTVIA